MKTEKDNETQKEYYDPWGFASYDIDKDDDDEPTIIYTRHEKSGRVNQYVDNNDGGHGHFSWEDENDYESSDEYESKTDYARSESNHHENPSQQEVEERSGCYLTSACIQNYQDKFDDNCYELSILRWFRDYCVPNEDVKHYYEVAPKIVESINKEKISEEIYQKIYTRIIVACVKYIEEQDYFNAYDKYKKTILAFEKKYCKQNNNDDSIEKNFVQTR